MKMPKNHFPNMYDDFSSESADKIINKSSNKISESFQNQFLEYRHEKFLQLTSSDMVDHIFHDSSVYTGSAGVAYYFYSSGLRNGKQDLLKKACSYIDLKRLKGKRISFLCGDAGPLALAAAISHKLGKERSDDLSDYKELVNRLISLESLLSESPNELLYGRSGYLYALLFINNAIGKKVIPDGHIKKVVSRIIDSGKRLSADMKSQSPLLWEWHGKIYFGAAHGMAGILYMLLQAREYMDHSDLENLVKPTIKYLVDRQFSSGNFPSSLNNSSDRLVQWCHGAPGFVPLLLLAHEVFHESRYLSIAIKCGDVIWERGLSSKGYSICHGVSGNAYAFIQLYQSTKELVHLYRAYCFMEWVLVERPNTETHQPDRPASLFEGLAGRLYAAEDFINVSEAKFPAFTV